MKSMTKFYDNFKKLDKPVDEASSTVNVSGLF